MDFSIIVPALNEEKRIRRCLDSIKAQKTGHTYELIVSDSGSTDSTVAISREYTDKIVVCNERGTARARNEGSKLASGNILIFIDSDTELLQDYLNVIYDAFSDDRVIAMSCAFKFTNRSPKLRFAEYVTNTYYVTRSIFRGTTLPGFNLCVRREVFEKLGGFRICHLEDLDMSIKLRKIGRTKYLSRRKVITSSRRLEQDGIYGTLKYYTDLFERTQNKRLGFHIVKLSDNKYDDYIHRE
ncbi:glycosyl transferase [Methanocella sp. CWC-04]|uniref:Glycosyl transferase n=1 Tax=Methanooceanicella nereidis TaxID=2052831 RepID=A0AAP2W717_9EURY|nr:glycosyltransferase [Methanocella sp. CWC-04]MCD1294656.1 glycosyl transferase [Methanocella sp. CWC-04]